MLEGDIEDEHSVALWVEPPPATRPERILAISTIIMIGVLMGLAVWHLFFPTRGITPINQGAWGFADLSYLALMALMCAALIAHASLGEDALRPRTMIALACTVGLAGTLLALVRGWYLMIGGLFSDDDSLAVSILGMTAIGILPFALPLTAGIILLRNDFEPAKWRVRAVSIAVVSAAAIIVIAALVPRWVRLAETGIW